MNYTQLTAAICDYTQNFDQDFIDNIPVFVKQAEQRIYNTVQFPSLRKNVTGVTTTNNKYLSAPSDFLAVYSLAVIDGTGAYEFLLNKDVNFIRQAYPSPTSQPRGSARPDDVGARASVVRETRPDRRALSVPTHRQRSR